MTNNSSSSRSRPAFMRIAKIHIIIGLFFTIQIIAYDAAKLITPEIVLKRWVAVSIFIASAAICLYLARLNNNPAVIRSLVWTLVAIDLAFASFAVYTQRGMASKAVLLFILAILTAAVFRRKSTIYLASVLAVVVYMVTAIAYFVLNFNEGYKIELYGEIGFYSALILAYGWIIWTLVRKRT